MVAAAVCSTEFMGFLTSVIFPLAAYAGVVAGIIIAATFMIGEATRNPKLTVWAKTEVLQLFISVISLVLLSSVIGLFCTLDMPGVAELFGFSGYSGPSSMFDAAENYLTGAAHYSHNALTVVRYHLEGYTVLGYMGEFMCDMATGPIGWGCWFGYSGTSGQPFGGYAAMVAALNTIFNATLMSYLMSLNYLMILIYVYKGFAFFLFPIGIFLRSMPYMRGFGSLLMSVAISFIIVYPFFLAVFDIMADDALFNRSASMPYLSDQSLSVFLNENTYPDHSAGVGASLASAFDTDYVKDHFYFQIPPGEKSAEAIAFGGMAFLAGFFFPSIALLAAIATTMYLARLYGEEVDLSRLMQMV
ncbi:hypothetical protein H0O02_04440 [Candidatus Micrarchaeota archaeon]|nr:hypothetical protein [Candidatus Micrarchaeota archaeon]